MDNQAIASYLPLFDTICRTRPHTVALKAGDRSITYAELFDNVNRLANYLIRKGVRPGTFVGLGASRTPDAIVSLLAIHRAGAAYVPLDPAYPPDRVKYVIEDAGLTPILVDRSSPLALPRAASSIIDVTAEAAGIEQEAPYPPGVAIPPEGLAYLMYTSGSTGHPKGVMVTHANLLNFVALVRRVLPVAEDDVYLQSAALTYAVSVRQIFVALSSGLELVIGGPSAIQDPIELFRLIRDEKVTLVDFVPSHWRSCIVALKTLPERDRTALLSNNLRRIVTVGEPLLPNLPSEWKQELKHPAELVNVFGQTETTGLITAHPVGDDPLDPSRVVSIGRPIPETRVVLVDPESLAPVPDGEIGELCVSNACVAKGYLHNPGLTAEKFVVDPFDETGRGRLYRTGDFARRGADGNIEYLGRGDQQVKVRGMRVELGEVESVLLRAKGVEEAAVIPRSRAEDGKYLVAFLSARGPRTLDVNRLRAYAKANLPGHMVPLHLVLLDELPHNANGKIDRRALAEYEDPVEDRGPGGDAASGPYERKLVEIWQKLLKTNEVRTTDHFFDDLGGDSLLAVLLFVEIEKEFGRSLPISSLYVAPTIEAIAHLLETPDPTEPSHSLVAIRPSGTDRPLFLVHGAGGNVLIYRDLARHLPETLPLYGLQSHGLVNSSTPLTSVGEMARAYVREVKKVQPSGPYYLCGYCMGGTVALQMAQELKKAGDEVAFLGMLETYNWSELPPRSLLDRTRFFAEKGWFHWKNIALLGRAGRGQFLTNKLHELKNRTRIWAGRVVLAAGRRRAARTNLLARNAEIWRLNDVACFEHASGYYDGRITVFLPKKRYAVHSVPEADWDRRYAREIDIVTLPLYPAAMLVEPFAQVLAEHLTAKIKEASSRQTSR